MISWKPIKNRKYTGTEKRARERLATIQKIAVVIFPTALLLLFASKKIGFAENIILYGLFATIVLGTIYYLKNRRNYISMLEKSKSVNRVYTEDYSWRDSLVMLGILIVGFIILLLLLGMLIPN